MTEERLNEIAQAIGADEARAKALFELSPEAAAEKLTKEGFAVTADELIAFGKEAKKALSKVEGELGENDLENVAGGLKLWIPTIPWKPILMPRVW